VKVSIIEATRSPIDVISVAAGACYGKKDASFKRVSSCFKAGHLSVFEHAVATLRVEGISRACMAQLTRHRIGSYCVESQRYCKYDLSGDDWYVIPPSFEGDSSYFRKCMREAAGHYMILTRGGMKPEDARYLLPEATKTNLVMSFNCRQLFHFLDMRLDKAAQWEIRNLAHAITETLKEHEGQWSDLMLLREE
jgi:thymidylate synthase (FAD)